MSDTLEQTDAQTVEVTRLLSSPLIHVWETLVSPQGAEAILGHGASLGSKGDSWQTEEGHRGFVRSFHPMEQLRVTWHETEDAPRSIVEIDLAPVGDNTQLTLRHDRVRGDDMDADKAQWQSSLEKFESLVVS